jgi:hypothetical protein
MTGLLGGAMDDSAVAAAPDVPQANVLSDFTGDYYETVLGRLHEVLQPRTYLEIGTCAGVSLALSRCAAIAVDPGFGVNDPEIMARLTDRPSLMLFQTTSDRFFAEQDPVRLFGRTVDFAFLDGLHRCEFLLRDFVNTERCCARNSLVALHDCLPVDEAMTARDWAEVVASSPERAGWWTGDVWRTALYLKRYRPDLDVTCLDAADTGLVLITNLDPEFHSSGWNYYGAVREMMSWHLSEIGLPALFKELGVQSTDTMQQDHQITTRYWL